MEENYYTGLIGRLRSAADWVNHQSEPSPEWDTLLIEAADVIQILYDWIPPFLKDDEGGSWKNLSSEQAIEHLSESVDKAGTSDLKSDSTGNTSQE